MKSDTKLLSECRLCQSTDLSELLSFGEVALGNNLQKNSFEAKKAARYPLNVMKCNSCSHFQLSHSVNKNLLYATNYSYLSGIAPSFVQHFKNYCEWIISRTGLTDNSTIIDIGSNDGTGLKFFLEKNFNVCH